MLSATILQIKFGSTWNKFQNESSKVTYLFVWCGVVKNVINSPHLGKDGTITEGVAYGSQPWCQVAERSDSTRISSGNHKEKGIDVQDDSTYPNQIVQLCTGYFY